MEKAFKAVRWFAYIAVVGLASLMGYGLLVGTPGYLSQWIWGGLLAVVVAGNYWELYKAGKPGRKDAQDKHIAWIGRLTYGSILGVLFLVSSASALIYLTPELWTFVQARTTLSSTEYLTVAFVGTAALYLSYQRFVKKYHVKKPEFWAMIYALRISLFVLLGMAVYSAFIMIQNAFAEPTILSIGFAIVGIALIVFVGLMLKLVFHVRKDSDPVPVVKPARYEPPTKKRVWLWMIAFSFGAIGATYLEITGYESNCSCGIPLPMWGFAILFAVTFVGSVLTYRKLYGKKVVHHES